MGHKEADMYRLSESELQRLVQSRVVVNHPVGGGTIHDIVAVYTTATWPGAYFVVSRKQDDRRYFSIQDLNMPSYGAVFMPEPWKFAPASFFHPYYAIAARLKMDMKELADFMKRLDQLENEQTSTFSP